MKMTMVNSGLKGLKLPATSGWRVRTPLWYSVFKYADVSFPSHLSRFSIVGSFRDREVACSASDWHSLNFESCVTVYRAVSSDSSHNHHEVVLAQISLCNPVHKGGLKPNLLIFSPTCSWTLMLIGGHTIMVRSKCRKVEGYFFYTTFSRHLH